MIFKPTLLKVCTSVLGGVGANYLFSLSSQKCSQTDVLSTNPAYQSACFGVPWADTAFDLQSLLVTVVSVVVVYIVWSLIQRKKPNIINS